jgi:uncharacterized protein
MKTLTPTNYTRNRLAKMIVLFLMTSIAYGQDLAGEWNGTLTVQGNQLRLVFHVNKTNNQFEATLDSPDQSINGIKVTATNFIYPRVKFEVAGLGAIYEGIMSGDNITGKWVQSGTALFLVLLRKESSPLKD